MGLSRIYFFQAILRRHTRWRHVPVSHCHIFDDIVIKLKSLGLDCNTILTCTSIFLYADDIMLISPSVSMLQTMLHLCEYELLDLDMSLNVK